MGGRRIALDVGGREEKERVTLHPACSPEPALMPVEDLPRYILHEDDHFLVVDKPGWIVCHPSKNGPCSSLAGVARLYLKAEKELHLLSRLDRETSGIVVFGKHRKAAREVQMAIEARQVRKLYWAIAAGEASEAFTVHSDLVPDRASLVHVKQKVQPAGKNSKCTTLFCPSAVHANSTFFKVQTLTGRKHQIRAHAQFAGYPLLGEKLYGPDETLYLEFVTEGWTPRLAAHLALPRQALHAARLQFNYDGQSYDLRAPWPDDWPSDLPGFSVRENPSTFEFLQ
jgi:23S rRNA pseudouridine1911/1915/1917 synthase